MKNQNVNGERPKKTFWGMIGYIATWLVFFLGVAIGIYGGYNGQYPNMGVMKLGIRIAVVAFLFMGLLHIVIFRLKGETQEKWIRILKRIGKWFGRLILIALVLLIINIIYGKIKYSKIPEVDKSMFQRSEHQVQLPDEEDALVQLGKLRRGESELWENLDAIYQGSITNTPNSLVYKDSKIGWYRNTDECILVYSGDVASCGTWVWNKETLSRILDREFNTNQWGTPGRGGYLSLSGEIVTIREYLDAKEPEIRADLQELDRILSMDYYLPNDKLLSLLPDFLQKYARGSMVMLMYYTDKEDWDMVDFIIKLNYKSVDILNHLGGLISVLISTVLQNYVDSTVNSAMQLFPEDFRLKLAQFYEENMLDRENIIHEVAKGEYVMWNEQIRGFKESYGNPILEMLINYPFYSEEDTERLVLYGYSLVYDNNTEEFNKLVEELLKKLGYSLYNIRGTFEYEGLMPRLISYNARIDWNIFHQQALIENLKSGEYKVWFNEKQWNDSPNYYDVYRLPIDEELAD